MEEKLVKHESSVIRKELSVDNAMTIFIGICIITNYTVCKHVICVCKCVSYKKVIHDHVVRMNYECNHFVMHDLK